MRRTFYYMSVGDVLIFAEELRQFNIGAFTIARLGYTKAVSGRELLDKIGKLEKLGFECEVRLALPTGK